MAGLLSLALAAGNICPTEAQSPKSLRVFYFGNSLTGCTMPAWHAELGKSAGQEWEDWAWLGAGWQLWQHREELVAGKDIFSGVSKGDLTIDESVLRSAGYHGKKFFGEKWDAVVLQIFGSYLTKVTDTMWNRKLSGAKDVGDLGAADDLIRLELTRNPEARCFLYQVWPPMESGQPRDGERGAEFPLREKFNYEARWLAAYDKTTEKPWIGSVNRTQDFSYQVFRGLQERFPELWKQSRLRMIPAGDLFLEIDRLAGAGQVPGVRDIRDFYTDVQHIRAGLPRYTVAATFYSCLFEEHPGILDWRLYNDATKYGADPYHDSGELLPITAENAAVVNEAIWKVVTSHPFAGLKQ
ncbi:MAG: hypothetical protein ACYC6Y_16620 [Thermoguttaceae bacterium]